MPRFISPNDRLIFIDATRGGAMGLVLLSHFGIIYFAVPGTAGSGLRDAVAWVTMVASPTFTIISGLLLGFLCTTKQERLEQLREKLWDRGLFLLTVGRALILGAHLLFRGTFRWIFITDACGVSMLTGAYLAGRLTARKKLALCAAAYMVSWAAIAWWHPHATWARYVSEGLFGSLGPKVYEHSFPLVPWFSIYLASSVIGERLGRMYLDGRLHDVPRVLRLGGLTAVTAACAMSGTAKLVRHVFDIVPQDDAVLSVLFGVHQKLPPSPAYVLFFGGIGILMLSGFCSAEQRHPNGGALKLASLIGRNSLFVFILQFYVYYVALDRMTLPRSVPWPIYLIASWAFIIAATFAFDRRGFNRFISVGFPRLQHRVAGLAAACLPFLTISH